MELGKSRAGPLGRGRQPNLHRLQLEDQAIPGPIAGRSFPRPIPNRHVRLSKPRHTSYKMAGFRNPKRCFRPGPAFRPQPAAELARSAESLPESARPASASAVLVRVLRPRPWPGSAEPGTGSGREEGSPASHFLRSLKISIRSDSSIKNTKSPAACNFFVYF